MTPYYSDESVTLWHGDSLEVLRTLPDGSVDCCVTSPPYYGLRDYGIEGQYGLEASPAEYVETMRALFSELRRVLADDGTFWLNLGDSYSTNLGEGNAGASLQGGTRNSYRRDGLAVSPMRRRSAGDGLPQKNLMGIPWRVAFALQDGGWILRNAIIWNKPNAMPESVTDRLSTRYEQVFLFSKSRRYWFDLDPIREVPTERTDWMSWADRKEQGGRFSTSNNRGANTKSEAGAGSLAPNPLGRNPGDVWTIATQPFSEAHFATMPSVLAERCIQSGCKPGGTVLDPFSGSGTTGLAAGKHGRRYVGIDLNCEYLDLSLRTRLAQAPLIGEDAS